MGARLTFGGQLAKLREFRSTRPDAGRIALATVSRHSFSSTSRKMVPCLSTVLQTAKASPVSLTAPVGTSAGRQEPSSLTKKGALQVAEKDVFMKHIGPKLQDMFIDPIAIDQLLEEVNNGLPKRPDGLDTPFSRIGGPTATSTSLASVLCLANAAGVAPEIAIFELYNQLAEANGHPPIERMSLPVPMSKIVDGGMHGAIDSRGKPVTPIQEFLFIPAGYSKWTDALSSTMEATERFWELMDIQGFDIKIGAEAGIISENLRSNRQVLQLMSMVIRGFNGKPPLPGMFIGMDVAASELFNEKSNEYFLGADGIRRFGSENVNFGEMISYYRELQRDFPSIISLEDAFAEEHLEAWEVGFRRLGSDSLQITDDATVTQPHLVSKFIKFGDGGLLTKVNQGGSFTRTATAMGIAAQNNWPRILSHRSSEAADFDFEAIMAIATGAEFLKVTIGSVKGGGGGREARVNRVSDTNVLMEALWKGMNPKHEDWDIFRTFWKGIPEDYRMDGLPYHGLVLRYAENAPAWLKRAQQLMEQRENGHPESYEYDRSPWFI